MAVDEAILKSCAESCAPPTLRIYSWLKPSISLGYLQPVTPARLDLEYCREAGIEIVRRITGGRAVIHGTDVTFSIALGESDLPEGCGSVIASHRWLMGGIVEGLRSLGIEAEIGPERAIAQSEMSADCFAHVAECDVRVGNEKVVGSAQVRRWGALLEQGSIPRAAPSFDVTRVFGRPAKPYREHLLAQKSPDEISQALIKGFNIALAQPLQQADLTTRELSCAADLAAEKYSTEAWTCRLK